jgi:hypothetical protein
VLGTGTGVGNIVEIVKYVSAFTTAVQTTRTLTINGTTYDLSADRTWTLTTSNITEGSNLYYTDTRARASLSFVAGSGGYNSTTGVITIPTNNNQITNGAGYITSSALSSYLPLAGGTLTGPLSINYGGGHFTLIRSTFNTFSFGTGIGSGISGLVVSDVTAGTNPLIIAQTTGAATFSSSVGIGVTPSYKFHVLGSSQVTSYFQTSGTYTPITWTGDNGTTKGGLIAHNGILGIGPLNAGGTGVDGDKSISINSTSGYVGIGGSTTNIPLTIKTTGNTLDGTFYSTFTINNTTSTSTSWSRIRFDRSGVAQWGIGEYDGKFRISNLYENGAVAANDSTFVIKNNNYIGISSANPLALLSIGSGSFADTNVVAQLSTGGGGTGAYFGYNKNGTYGLLVGMSNGLDGWTAGIIRQISADPLYFIVNNNTIAMNIQNGGQILTPRQPAFMAYGNGNTTIDASGTYIIYPSVHLNRGSHYNASNGVFTVPVSGVYFFSWTAIGNTTNDVYRWWLRINNVNFLGDAQLRQDTNETGTAYASNGNRQVIANLNAGDTVRIYFVSDAGSQPYGANDTVNAYLNFMGYLIG